MGFMFLSGNIKIIKNKLLRIRNLEVFASFSCKEPYDTTCLVSLYEYHSIIYLGSSVSTVIRLWAG